MAKKLYLAELEHLKLSNHRGLSIVWNGLGLLLLCSPPGWAHGAIATVTRTFLVEANYSSGEPMALAQVIVYSPGNSENPWTTGQTNEAGEFEFSPDAAGNWEVVIRQAGHGTTVSVPVATATETAPKGTASLVAQPSPLHRWASAGAALWGLIGTVLFFSRGK
ncbi:MAG: carboxypeptidase-like regulatory domain-containing protein [Cyanobacteria bacterium P01_F01_bin.116]